MRGVKPAAILATYLLFLIPPVHEFFHFAAAVMLGVPAVATWDVTICLINVFTSPLTVAAIRLAPYIALNVLTQLAAGGDAVLNAYAAYLTIVYALLFLPGEAVPLILCS